MNKKILRYIAIVICASVLIFSTYKLLHWTGDSRETINQLDEIASSNIQNKQTKSGSTAEETSSPLRINFDQLKKKNADTVGWIRIGSTEVNTPFVQTKDNEYYLNHSFNKKSNDAGWLFLDYRDDIENPGKNSIIYGHNRRDGTMFGTLNRALKQDWQKNSKNQIIELSTPKENTYWQVFSVYKYEPETYYLTTDFATDQDYQKFLDTIKKRSLYDFKTDLTVSDKILTLSTCDKTTNRIVLHAKLIKTEKR